MTGILERVEFIERLRELAAEGLTKPQAAKRMGVAYALVYQRARAAQIKFAPPRKPAGEREHTMRVLYLEGYTLQQIGDQYGLTRERVRQLLTKHFSITAVDGGAAETGRRNAEERRADLEARCLAKKGCAWAEYKSLVKLGRQMMAAGSNRERTPIGAFNCQRQNAKARGIGWELTLWQWWQIWNLSGKWDQRGRGQGYVMCRRGDVGPYAVGNVFIAPARENSSDKPQKKSGLPIGVVKSRGLYVAHRSLNGKQHWLGSFKTPELAHAAYLNAAPEKGAAA